MDTMIRTRSALTVLAALAATGAWAQNYLPKAIFTEIAASATSAPPGIPGAKFDAFDRPFVSPDGTKWLITADTDGATSADELLIVGAGPTRVGATILVQEGSPCPVVPGANWGILRTQAGIDDQGRFAFSADTSAATTLDEVVARYNGSTFELIAQEGAPSATEPSVVFGNLANAVHILNNGAVRFRGAGISGVAAAHALFSFTDPGFGTLLGQTSSTIPTGQLTGSNLTVREFRTDRFVSAALTGDTLYVASVGTATATDEVVVLNGAVIGQEGFQLPIPGSVNSVFNFHGDTGSQMLSPNGQFFALRGAYATGTTNADRIDFVRINNDIVAETDLPIHPGSGETFSDTIFGTTFFINVVNDNGDYVVGGTTDEPDVNKDAVLVVNGKWVLARQGDPVDIDGNGLADDDAFINIFNNDDSFLTADRLYYFMAELRSGGGTNLGQAFLVMKAVIPGDANYDDRVDLDDYFDLADAFRTGPNDPAWNPRCDFDGSEFIDLDDYFILADNYRRGT